MVGMKKCLILALLLALAVACEHKKPQIIELRGLSGPGVDKSGGPAPTGDDVTIPQPDSASQTGSQTGSVTGTPSQPAIGPSPTTGTGPSTSGTTQTSGTGTTPTTPTTGTPSTPSTGTGGSTGTTPTTGTSSGGTSGMAPLADNDYDGIPDLSDLDDDNDGTPDGLIYPLDSQPFNPLIPGPLAGLVDGEEFPVVPDENNIYGLSPTIALGSQLVLAWKQGGDIFVDLPLLKDPAFRKQITTGGNHSNPHVAILNRSGTNGNLLEFVVVWNTFRDGLRDIKYKIFQFKVAEKQLINLIAEGLAVGGIPQDSKNANWIGLDSNRAGDFVIGWVQEEKTQPDDPTQPIETVMPLKTQMFLRGIGNYWQVLATHTVHNPNPTGNVLPSSVENPDIALSDNLIAVSFKGYYAGVCKNDYEFLSKTDNSLQFGNAASCTTQHPDTGLPVYEEPYKVAGKSGDQFIFATLKTEGNQLNYYYKEVNKDDVDTVALIKQTLRVFLGSLGHSFQEMVVNKDGHMMALANVTQRDVGPLGNLISMIPPSTSDAGVRTIADDTFLMEYNRENSIVVSDNNRYAICYRKHSASEIAGGIFCKSWTHPAIP